MSAPVGRTRSFVLSFFGKQFVSDCEFLSNFDTNMEADDTTSRSTNQIIPHKDFYKDYGVPVVIDGEFVVLFDSK